MLLLLLLLSAVSVCHLERESRAVSRNTLIAARTLPTFCTLRLARNFLRFSSLILPPLLRRAESPSSSQACFRQLAAAILLAGSRRSSLVMKS